MKRSKKYSWPSNHWSWPVPLSHQHGVRAGNIVFTGGQADLNGVGEVVSPGNLEAQTRNVLKHLDNILIDLDAKLDDLVKLVIYFTGDAAAEKEILDIIADYLNSRRSPVVSTICLPELCYPGMRIELEGVAVIPEPNTKSRSIRCDDLPALHPAFSHVVETNGLVFTSDMSAINPDGSIAAPGDLSTQTIIMMDRLCVALSQVGIDTNAVAKLNVFYLGDGTAANWSEAAKQRAAYFADPGPAATGIAVNSFAQPGLMTKIAVTAYTGINATNGMEYALPDGHWIWTEPLPYKHGNRFGRLIHIGGQVALDNNADVLHPGDIVEQTEIALSNLGKVLAEFGANLDDVIKVTTFYQGTASAEGLHTNLQIRSAAFSTPGPATSGIPVTHLVYENMMIEIEVIAYLDNEN